MRPRRDDFSFASNRSTPWAEFAYGAHGRHSQPGHCVYKFLRRLVQKEALRIPEEHATELEALPHPGGGAPDGTACVGREFQSREIFLQRLRSTQRTFSGRKWLAQHS